MMRSTRDPGLLLLYSIPLLFYGLTVLLPILGTLLLSFYRWDGIGDREWIGLANWGQLFRDEHFSHALKISFAFTLAAWVVQTPLALGLGIYFAQRGFFRQTAAVFAFLPLLFSATAVGIIWLYILDPNLGILYYIPPLRGLNPLSESFALATLALVTSWQYIPFHTLLYQAAYQGIPHELYEAASLDGAGEWDVFWHITLPLLRPTIITSSFIIVVGSLTYFDLIWVMTQGGPGYATTNLPVYLYRLAFQSQNVGYGATVGAFLALLALGLSWLLVGRSGVLGRRWS